MTETTEQEKDDALRGEVSSSNALVMRIEAIANTHCGDYPNIEKADAMEKLYAIESTLAGTDMANKDLHSVIEKLRKKCGMSVDEVFEMFDDA